MTLSRYLRGYLQTYQKDYDYRHQGIVASFEVDDLALSVGKFYEQIRKVIDWKEENALRRGAIARAIKRNLVTQVYSYDRADTAKLHEVAEAMVLELMRSGYFNNNYINAEKVTKVAKILQKYLIILQDLNSGHEGLSKADLKGRIKSQTWTIEVAACELEECLMPPFKTRALIGLMREVMGDQLKVIPESSLSPTNKAKFLEIAIWRSLFGADDYFLSYILLKATHPQFFSATTQFTGQQVRSYLAQRQIIEQDLNHRTGRQFLRIANKYDAAYRLIGNITNRAKLASIADGEAFFESEEKVKGFFTEIYQEKIKSLKIRLLKTAFWTTLSILFANIASVVILEWPIAGLLGYDFGFWAIFWDIMIPSIAMFALVMLIRPPRKENELTVWEEITKIIYKQEQKDIYEIRLTTRSNSWLQGFFFASTVAAGLAGLLGIGFIFSWAGLPPTSVYLNVVYITMVLFASLNIRSKAQEVTIFEHTGFFDFVLDIFAIPLARIGQWFSKKWKEYNIFSIIFSIIIDAPLSLLIGFIEQWRSFLKESKSEIR